MRIQLVGHTGPREKPRPIPRNEWERRHPSQINARRNYQKEMKIKKRKRERKEREENERRKRRKTGSAGFMQVKKENVIGFMQVKTENVEVKVELNPRAQYKNSFERTEESNALGKKIKERKYESVEPIRKAGQGKSKNKNLIAPPPFYDKSKK